MRRTWLIVPLALTLIIAGILIFFPSDKKRVWKVIVSSEKAISDENLDGLMENISYNYRDEYGGTFLLAMRRMQSVFNKFNKIDTELQLIKISVNNKEAEAEINVRVTATHGEDSSYIIADPVNWQRMIIYLDKSPYTWKIIKVKGLVDYDQ
jgi:hypothetical protein